MAHPEAGAVGARKKAEASKEKTPSRERVPEIRSPYLIAEVEERQRKGGKVRMLRVFEGEKETITTEKQIEALSGITWNSGDVLALEKGTSAEGKAILRVIDNLGAKGTVQAEIGRVAYSIGNGAVFPEKIRYIEEEIIRDGQSIVENEIARLAGTKGGLITWNDPAFPDPFPHGEGRMDFRELRDVNGKEVPIITIDPLSARDHDDAVHACEVEVGGVRFIQVGVHIADVSHFVPIDKNDPRHALFEVALERGQTLYSPRRAFHMLPRALSEQLCSLKAGQEKLSFSTLYFLDPATGEIKHTWQGKSVVKPHANITYETSQRLFDDPSSASPQEERLVEGNNILFKTARALAAEREARGEIAFPERYELDVIRDVKTDAEIAGVKKNLEANRVIQSWMIKPNEDAAITVLNAISEDPERFYGIFRFHEPPKVKDLYELAQTYRLDDIVARIEAYERNPELFETRGNEPPFVNALVVEMLERAKTMELWARVTSEKEARDAIAGNPKHPLRGADAAETDQKIKAHYDALRDAWRDRFRERVMRRFTKAKATTDPRWHFGLSKYPYMYTTSPIRRDSDIFAQHGLVAALARDPSFLGGMSLKDFQDAAQQMNDREYIVDRAEELCRRIFGAGLFGSLRTPQNQEPEIHNVIIESVPLKGAEKEDRVVQVQMRHPSGDYPFKFFVPISTFKGLPSGDEGRNELLGKPQTVRLTGVDIENGTVELELVSEKAPLSRRERVPAEMVATMKQLHLDALERIEDDFPESVRNREPVRNEIAKLRAAAESINEKWAGSAIDKVGSRIGSLRGIMERMSGKTVAELLELRHRPKLRAKSEPAPATPRPGPREAAPAAAPADRFRAMEEQLEILRERERVLELQQQLRDLESGKK